MAAALQRPKSRSMLVDFCRISVIVDQIWYESMGCGRNLARRWPIGPRWPSCVQNRPLRVSHLGRSWAQLFDTCWATSRHPSAGGPRRRGSCLRRPGPRPCRTPRSNRGRRACGRRSRRGRNKHHKAGARVGIRTCVRVSPGPGVRGSRGPRIRMRVRPARRPWRGASEVMRPWRTRCTSGTCAGDFRAL